MKAHFLEKTNIDIPLKTREYQISSLKENEVLIETKAFAINPVDIKTRSGGGIFGMINNEPDIILGWDVSGVITKTGSKVSKFKTGDEVFGMVNFPGHGKAYASHVAAPEDHLTKKPNELNHEQSAASTLAPLTAWQIMNRHIKPGMRVLIHGASGGVGHFAVQIAKMLGANVIATTSTRNIEFVASLGADEIIDYTLHDFSEQVSDIDFVFDTIAGEVLEKSLKVVKNGGTIISIPTSIPPHITELAKNNNIHVAFELVESNGDDMQKIADLLKSEKLIPTISLKFAFSQIEEAHKQMATGKTRGKIVISL